MKSAQSFGKFGILRKKSIANLRDVFLVLTFLTNKKTSPESRVVLETLVFLLFFVFCPFWFSRVLVFQDFIYWCFRVNGQND